MGQLVVILQCDYPFNQAAPMNTPNQMATETPTVAPLPSMLAPEPSSAPVDSAPEENGIALPKPPLHVVKRDGSVDNFDPAKIRTAVGRAYTANGREPQTQVVDHIVGIVTRELQAKGELKVEEIQDMVEKELMAFNPFIAKKYIIYREWRNTERHKRTELKHTMDGIVQIETNDVNLSNANMSSHTPAGQMMTFASEVTKDYTRKYLLNPRYAQAHANGDIHIHDMDYYPTKTTTCLQYDLQDLFERGFHTKNGTVRTPQSIQSYATLATIIFQTNQNEQHGGQAIPAFDFFMAPGVRKSFWKHVGRNISFIAELGNTAGKELPTEKTICRSVRDAEITLGNGKQELEAISGIVAQLGLPVSEQQLQVALDKALAATERDTHQAMEGFIHNLNTMHSRGGNQVVFSSINYGTDTSPEGRMLIRCLLQATEEGLGQGEVPIFPIQIFKVKDGVNYSSHDIEAALANYEAAAKGEIAFDCPNFDLFLLACQTTARALFPNFVFLDTPFNADPDWKADDPKRYFHEVATMGCRTRVYENLNGPRTSIGRGNLSFTSINMPRLAILARQNAESRLPEATNERIQQEAKKLFLGSLREMATLVADQLYERYQYQQTAVARQFPFMMGNDVWKGGGALNPNDKVTEVLKQGTLGIGFIGGHNAMMALYGQSHAQSTEAWNTLHEAIGVLGQVVEEYKQRYGLNYSVLATPAEGLSGRFTKADQKRFGIIKGVNDRDYYVNSFHVDVKEPVSILDKIRLEAPFHAQTLGGHITYVELDGEAKKNVKVMVKIVRAMHDAGIGYGSINHPVDTCKRCGYKGVIYDKCPVCQSDQIARLRRITGYLTGSLESWNSAKQAEEHDRVKHR